MKSDIWDYLRTEIPELTDAHGLRRYFVLTAKRILFPSYDAVYMIRYCDYTYANSFIKKIKILRYKRKLVNKYGIFFNIEKKSSIGKGLFLPHPSSIVIGAGVNIGDGTQIGANSVCMTDTEKNSIYAGAPAVRKR